MTCDVQSDGTVKGRKMPSFLVGLRNQATDADTPFADVNIKFESDVYDIVNATFPLTEVEGVFDVDFTVTGTPTDSEIIFSATKNCTSENVASFVQADMAFTTASGVDVTLAAVSYDANTKLYTATSAAGFVTGGSLKTAGVILKANEKLEGSSIITI